MLGIVHVSGQAGAGSAGAGSAGGCAASITFAEGCAGWNYRVTDGAGETYTGFVPDSLTVELTLKKCSTEYTVTAWDEEGHTWTNKVTTGPYFGPVESTVTDFAAVLTVATSAGAKVTAVCGNQSYSTSAGADGAAELSIGTPGRYTVTAVLEEKTASGFVEVQESKSYVLELRHFQTDLNIKPVARGYIVFEPEEWTGNELRIPQSVHRLEAKQTPCIYTLRHRTKRNARDFLDAANAEQGKTAITEAVTAALNANAAAPGTYPAAEDGHIVLTWAQVQYVLLEGELVSADAAAAKATEKSFSWQDRETLGTPETATLDDLLKAAYLPALGGSSSGLDALCTAEVLQGLRLRRREDGVEGAVAKYDLDGVLTASTWAVIGSKVFWDTAAQELVLQAETPYAGDLLVMG